MSLPVVTNSVGQPVEATPVFSVSQDGSPSQDATSALVPLGYSRISSLSAAAALTSIPAGTTVALIQAEGRDVRWRDDGTNPTTSTGVLLAAGAGFWYRGTFAAIRFIEVAAGGLLNVSYYQETVA